MVLDNVTFEKVAALFTIPVNSVRYAGAWGRNTRKQPTVTEPLPFHPSGSIPSIYKM